MATRNKHVRWVFTLNNYSQDDLLKIQDCCDRGNVLYCIVGMEEGERGTPHLQGYIHFLRRTYLTGVSKLLPRAHWEPANGTELQNIAYCSKGGEYYEFGTRQDESKRSSSDKRRLDRDQIWAESKILAKQGRLDDITPEIFIKHYGNLRRIVQDNPQDIDNIDGDLTKINLWIWGPPGTGKSRFARWLVNDTQYDKNCNKWWCGYLGQEDVIIDDFDKDHKVLAHFLKVWADRYKFTAETKGGSMCIRPKRLIVTSNYCITDIDWDGTTQLALARRFRVLNFDDPLKFDDYDEFAKRQDLERSEPKTLVAASHPEVVSDGSEDLEAIQDLLDEEEQENIAAVNGYATPDNSDQSEADYITRSKRIYHKHPRKPVEIVDLTNEDDPDLPDGGQTDEPNYDSQEEFYNMN